LDSSEKPLTSEENKEEGKELEPNFSETKGTEEEKKPET